MRREKTSVSQEDYLEAIREMLEEARVAINARLAEELDVTPPAGTAYVLGKAPKFNGASKPFSVKTPPTSTPKNSSNSPGGIATT